MANNELKIECEEAPKSPLSQVFLRLFSPKSEQIINCAMSFRDPIDVEALKKDISNSIIIKHPRFCSLMIRDHTGKHWKTTHVNVDDHIIVHQTATTTKAENDDGHDHDDDDEKEGAINSFLADISVSKPLSEKKPLWEVHVLLGLKCVVFRVHHSLGDGASLMSMLSACFGNKMNNETLKSDNNNNNNTNGVVNGDHCSMKNNHIDIISVKKKGGESRRKKGVWLLVKSLWFTLLYLLRVLGRILWVKDKVSVVSGGAGVELWPRKLVTAKFLLEDFKSIKTLVPQVTVNDVLLGVISSGISKYLTLKSPHAQKALQLQLTALNMVNLRKHPYLQETAELMSIDSNRLSGWGNKTGLVLLPICCCNGLHPLDHVRAMKATMDRKKDSYEAYFLYKTMDILVYLGATKVASWCYQKLLSNTTLTITNIKGPMEEIVIDGNPVTHMRVNLSSLPQAITIHMISYAGKADLQVMVAKDVIPDPEILVKCFQDSFQEIKNSINQITTMV